MDDIFTGSPLENVGSETILQFIQKTVSKYNDIEDILEHIPIKRKEEKEEHLVSFKEEGEAEPRQITASAKGFYYERLWDICIKFGVSDLTLGITPDKKHQTTHIFDNSNKEAIKVNENCWSGDKLKEFLSEKVRSGNSGGYSDITFVNKSYGEQRDEEVYFISVKYFKKEKDIGEYDIGKLCTLIREHEKENRTIKLYICVNNKKEAIEKFEKQHRSSAILLKYINPRGKYEHVYDAEDLRRMYFNLRKLLEQYNYLKKGEDVERFNTEYLKTLKAVFVPRFHQKLFISKINELIDTGKRHMLVGAIPRSGKSYIMAGTILEYVKRHASVAASGKKLNFLLMTPAPNETFPEYKSIFDDYIDFDKHKIETKLYNEEGTTPAADKHTVHIISKQKLGYIEGDDDEPAGTTAKAKMTDEEYIQKIRENFIKIFKDIPHFDIVFLDEAHFGMSTERAKKIVEELTRTFDEYKNTTQIYVTATYRRPLKEYNVADDCKLTWDLTDIEVMKHLGEPKYPIKGNKIENQFSSKIYNDTLKYYGDEKGVSIAPKLKKDYEKYPKPYLLTPLWDKEFVKVEKSKIGNTEFGWSMDNLFSTKGGSFENTEQVKEMMRYYFGYPNKEKNYEEQSFYRTRGIIPRIRNICMNHCRTQQQKHKTTQLWFLPVGTGRIQDKISSLISLLTDASEFKDIANTYHFYAAVEVDRPVDSEYVTYMKDPKKIKKEIEELEQVLRGEKGKRQISGDNLIILAGQRLQLGISLRNVDIVTLWNSIKSSDAIFQMLFRSMTEVDGSKCDGDGGTKKKREDYCGEKKFGFMVDMDPQRALINVSLFSDITAKPKTNEEEQRYKEITDLINIDEDVFHDRFGDNDTARKNFVNELFDKLYSSWNKNVENTKEIIGKFELDMDKLNKLKEQLKRIYTDKSKKTDNTVSEPDDTGKFDKKKGREKEGEPGNQDETAKKKKKAKPEIEINLKEKATEIISEYVSLLNIFTLYRDDGTKCILSDTSNNNAKAKVITDIHELKKIVFEKDRDIFLQILKGRLTGNNDEPEDISMYENLTNEILNTISDDSDNLTINKLSMIQKKKYYTIHEPDKLLEYINQNIKPKEQERKENGEVFTPLWLVKQMLDELDNAYIKEHARSIFTEKEFKWLDPAVGIGNFPIILYQRLMGKKDENGKWEGGLSLAFPNEEDRRKHILENMLYMVEISSKSIYILNKIFCGKKEKENEKKEEEEEEWGGGDYKLNIHTGSFLNGSCKYDFMFDVVMGNPPYNPPKTDSGSSGNSIWQHFVMKSYYLVKDHGYLLFIHPPGWKKPTPTDEIFDPVKLDISNGEYYKHDKKTGKQTIKQIRQGIIWCHFKENGVFHFIYTNDQKDKKLKDVYIPYFPAVDYYVYQKKGYLGETCKTKNIFTGEIKEGAGVKINYKLNYLPNLITNQTQDILHKITTKQGKKIIFNRGIDERKINWNGKVIDWVYDANKKGFQYKKHEINASSKSGKSTEDTVHINKIILNFGGGFTSYNVKYVSKSEEIGVLDKTMYSIVENNSEGKCIEKFFNTDIVKFIFLITQYASGAITQNEHLVANSITIPPEEEKDYYKFFGIEHQKIYIEDTLSNYYKKQTTSQKETKDAEKPIASSPPINAAADVDDVTNTNTNTNSDTDTDSDTDSETDTDDDINASIPVRNFVPGIGHNVIASVEPKKQSKKTNGQREKKQSSSITKKITKVASRNAKAEAVVTAAVDNTAETPSKKRKPSIGSKNAKSSKLTKGGGRARGSKRNRRTLKRKRN